MAYDRYDTRRDRWHDERARHEDRGFFERAGDEIASWFGDDDAERRRREDERMNHNGDRDRGHARDFDRDRFAYRSDRHEPRSQWRDRDRDFDRDRTSGWTSGKRDDRSGWAGYDRDYAPRGYGYGSSLNATGPKYVGGYGYTGGYGYDYGAGNDRGYGSSGYGAEFTGQRNDRDSDRHYHAWRQRQLDDLDRDYDQYCRERQDRFESDFGSWRRGRMSKRQHLGSIREHMDVVGSDGESIGKVDHVRGDHIVLTKSDSPDNRHHLLDCSMIETVEGDQVRLGIKADEAKSRWEDGDNRGFFGRRDEETNLNRSFSGTYES